MYYSVGIAFTYMYDQVWKITSIKPIVKYGAVVGALSGLAGIALRSATIAMHPNPPIKDYNSYYKHLLLTHIFFGIAAAESYKHSQYLPEKEK